MSSGESGGADNPPVEPGIASELRELARDSVSPETNSLPPDTLPADLRHLPERDHRQDIGLKKTYATSLLLALGAQMAVTDAAFVAYAWVGEQWRVPVAIMTAWLSTTLVQVIGVVTIVVHYLFPRRA